MLAWPGGLGSQACISLDSRGCSLLDPLTPVSRVGPGLGGEGEACAEGEQSQVRGRPANYSPFPATPPQPWLCCGSGTHLAHEVLNNGKGQRQSHPCHSPHYTLLCSGSLLRGL